MENGTRILVADDESAIRGVLAQVLGDEGYQVTVAESGEKALEIFQKDPHHLVITDIRMGGMSGMDLLKEIKKINPKSQVIIMTSYASLETAILALRAGAYDYLIKPFEELDLVTATVARATETIRLTRENQELIETLKGKNEELEELNKILKEQATYDGLTGLHNHRYFQEALAMEVSRSLRHKRVFSLVFLDVDSFKAYNDTHGHLGGDAVLRTVGTIIKGLGRKADLAARYGGDEFVILLPETCKESSKVVAERIRSTVESHPFPGREEMPMKKVTISVGISTFPEDGADSQTLIQAADKALYDAKQSGRNVVCVAG